jgi:hypothetical protein
MDNAFFEWLGSGGWDAIGSITLFALMITSTVLTKVLNKPESKMVAGGIKLLGGGAYKDENANWSLPFDPRTK